MSKITSLTPEQQKYLPVYREKMRALGLRTQWADDETIRSSVTDIYSAAGLDLPTVLVFDSPLMCLAARHLLKNSKPRGQPRGQLRGQLGDQLWGQLWDQLRDQLWGQLRGQLRGQLWGQLWIFLWSSQLSETPDHT